MTQSSFYDVYKITISGVKNKSRLLVHKYLIGHLYIFLKMGLESFNVLSQHQNFKYMQIYINNNLF